MNTDNTPRLRSLVIEETLTDEQEQDLLRRLREWKEEQHKKRINTPHDTPTPEDAAIAKFRAEWLHNRGAPGGWLILTEGEVAVLKSELSRLTAANAALNQRHEVHWQELSALRTRVQAVAAAADVEQKQLLRENAALKKEVEEWHFWLDGWGGTPEIIDQFIKGQQERIRIAQDIEKDHAAVAALLHEAEEALRACGKTHRYNPEL